MKNLSKALDCEQEDIVLEGFMDRYNVTIEEAKEILLETKKWLWLAAQSSKINPEGLFIDKPLAIIDEMWHNFLLHTIPYYKFCMQKFNKYIHHVPTSGSEKLKFQKQYEEDENEIEKIREERTKKQYRLIYDHLGPETLEKWYGTMANKYTPEYIDEIRKY